VAWVAIWVAIPGSTQFFRAAVGQVKGSCSANEGNCRAAKKKGKKKKEKREERKKKKICKEKKRRKKRQNLYAFVFVLCVQHKS
jgi:hypothetical protein